MVEFGEEKAAGKNGEPPQSTPSQTEREKDKQTHFDEIIRIQKDMIFLESVRKVTNDEPSRESLGRSVEILRETQGKLYRSLYVRYGIDVEEADKIIDNKKSEADTLAALRERVAMYGYGAIKEFENSGQFDVGTLKDLANRAVNVRGTPEPPQVTQTQTTSSQAEQEKIVANLIELSNREKWINQQLTLARKTLSSDEIKELKQDRDQTRQEYKEKFAEIVKRPDREQIIKMWENALKLELKIEREAKAKEQDKMPSKTK